MLLKTNVEKPPMFSWQRARRSSVFVIHNSAPLRGSSFAMNIIKTKYIVQSTSQNRYPQNNVSLPKKGNSLPNRSISTELNPNLVKRRQELKGSPLRDSLRSGQEVYTHTSVYPRMGTSPRMGAISGTGLTPIRGQVNVWGNPRRQPLSLNSPLIEDHKIFDLVGACNGVQQSEEASDSTPPQLDKADRGQKLCFSPNNQPSGGADTWGFPKCLTAPSSCPDQRESRKGLPPALPEGLVKSDSSSIETQETTRAGVNLGGADHE